MSLGTDILRVARRDKDGKLSVDRLNLRDTVEHEDRKVALMGNLFWDMNVNRIEIECDDGTLIAIARVPLSPEPTPGFPQKSKRAPKRKRS